MFNCFSRICFLNKHNTLHNTFKPHTHSCYEIIYFLSGSGHVVIGNQNYPFCAHSYCIVSPDVLHTECIDDSGEILFIGFQFHSDDYTLNEGMYHQNETELYALLNAIFHEYQKQYAGYPIAMDSLLNLMIIYLSRINHAANVKGKDLDYIRAYIDHHYNQNIHFSDLSKISGYSYDHFRHLFKKRFHYSPQEYMIRLRLNKAHEMLLSTDLSCTEISYACGFSNSAQMSSMFKKRFQLSPIQLRKNRSI